MSMDFSKFFDSFFIKWESVLSSRPTALQFAFFLDLYVL